MAEDSSSQNLDDRSQNKGVNPLNSSKKEVDAKSEKRRIRPGVTPKVVVDKAKDDVTAKVDKVKSLEGQRLEPQKTKKKRKRRRRRPKKVSDKHVQSRTDDLAKAGGRDGVADITIGKKKFVPPPITVGNLREEDEKTEEKVQQTYEYKYQESEKPPEHEITEITMGGSGEDAEGGEEKVDEVIEPEKVAKEEEMPPSLEEDKAIEDASVSVVTESHMESEPKPGTSLEPEFTPEEVEKSEKEIGAEFEDSFRKSEDVPKEKSSWEALVAGGAAGGIAGGLAAGAESEKKEEEGKEREIVEEQRNVEVTEEKEKKHLVAAEKSKYEAGMAEEELLEEKGSVVDVLGRVALQVWNILARVFNVRVIGGIIMIGVIIWGVMWGLSQDFVKDLFGGDDTVLEVVAVDSVDFKEVLDNDLLRETGIASSLLFGANMGSYKDVIPVQIQIADYFGHLREPKVSGETGISAATYFGELMDEKEIINLFVEYIETLEKVRNLYKIDVYAMLDRNEKRDRALTQYLADLKDAREESDIVLKSIRQNIDELTISYNSLKDDKNKFEVDFFTSLEELQAEKSDVLLKSFVDSSQKQTALKARVAALDRLVSYYENALQRLDNRISAVESNRRALEQGIRVVDVPGSGIDLIIKIDEN